MPKDIMPKVTYCPKTLCPIWQFAQEDILPKDFMPKVTICPKRTICPRRHFAHVFERSFVQAFLCIIYPYFWGFISIHFTKKKVSEFFLDFTEFYKSSYVIIILKVFCMRLCQFRCFMQWAKRLKKVQYKKFMKRNKSISRNFLWIIIIKFIF